MKRRGPEPTLGSLRVADGDPGESPLAPLTDALPDAFAEECEEEEPATDDEQVEVEEVENEAMGQQVEQAPPAAIRLELPQDPPLPPPLDEARPPREPRVRLGPAAAPQNTIRVEVPGHGALIYYTSSNVIQAHCRRDGHSDCWRERTCAAGRRKGQGRPLGFLTAWLLQGAARISGQEHVHRSRATHAERVAGREHLATLEGSGQLFDKERERVDGEPEEPVNFS